MLAFTNLWILTTRPDRGHPKQQEDETNIIWQDARGGRLRLHQWERRCGTVLQARGEALIYELAQEWTRILIPLTKLSRGSWRSFNFHMAPMKQLVTLSPSKCLIAGSRTTYFRICYRTSWVLFIRETVVCILIHPFGQQDLVVLNCAEYGIRKCHLDGTRDLAPLRAHTIA